MKNCLSHPIKRIKGKKIAIHSKMSINSQLIEVLQNGLAKKLAEKFGLDVNKVSECIGEYLWADSNDCPPKPSAPSVPSVETCSAILKKGGARCTKKWSVVVDGQHFCGMHKPKELKASSTKKDDAKSTENDEKEEAPKAKKSNTKKLPTKKGSLKDNQEKTNSRLDALVKKTIMPPEISLSKVGDRTIDTETRLLFNGAKVYGKLADDDETILQLEEEDHAVIDKWGLSVCPTPLSELSEETDELEVEF
jgi:hypothetical protein